MKIIQVLLMLMRKLIIMPLWRGSLAGMRSLWDVSIRSPLREASPRPLRNISKRCLFCGVFKTSQVDLIKDFFFVTSLRRLKHTPKRWLFCNVFDMLQKYLLKVLATFEKYLKKNGLVLIKQMRGLEKRSLNESSFSWSSA